MSDAVIAILEQYTCAILWQSTGESVNAVGTKLFEKEYIKEDKVTDVSLFPPSNSVDWFCILNKPIT